MVSLRSFELALELRDNSQEGFVTRYKAPFLLQVISPEEESTFGSFKTGIATGPMAAARLMREGFELRNDLSKAAVHSVQKRPDSPWQDRIIVGRARNGDVVIQHSSISKVHAYITFDDKGGVLVRDANSRNGTRVNGKAVSTEESVRLPKGATLQLGDITLELVDAATVYTRFRSGVFQRTGG